MPARKPNPQPWWKCSECGYIYMIPRQAIAQ